MRVQKPIQDECFRVEQDVDASILLAHEVRGLADAPAKLIEQGLLDGDTLSVMTLLEIGPDGQILNSRVGIAGPIISQKTLANKLFAQAPESARLRMKLDYRAFNFPPGLTVSDWISSDDLQWSIMKSNNMAQGGIYDQAEHKDINVSKWSCRAVITPTEESHVACVSLVAIPRPIDELNNLPGTATGLSSAAYPVICLGESRAAMAGVLETPRHDGLAFYPVVVNRGQPGSLLVAPDSGSLRVAMRGIWSGNIEPNSLVASDWCLATQGPGEPDQTPIEAEFAWPQVEQQVEEEDSATEMEGGGLDLAAQTRRRAELLAESIRQTNGLPPPFIPLRTGPAQTALSMTTTITTTTTTTTTTSSTGSGSTNTRPRCSVGSSATNDSQPTPPLKKRRVKQGEKHLKKKTSEKVLPQHWPRGYSKEMIDELTPADVIALKRQEMDADKEEKEFLPGSGKSKRDHKIPTKTFAEQDDNCRDKLHDARTLRQCVLHPESWYGMVPTRREEIFRNIKLSIFGSENQVASTTIAAMHDRGRNGIKLKHFLYRNKDVEDKPAKTTTSLSRGEVQHSLEHDFEEASSIDEMLRGLANYAAVMYFLWPTDYSAIVMLSVATDYGFFRKAGRKAPAVFNAFCNKVISANSDDPDRHPLVYDEAEKIATTVLSQAGALPYKPPIANLLEQQQGELSAGQGNQQQNVGSAGGFLQQPGAPRPNNAAFQLGKVPANWGKLLIGKEKLCGKFQSGKCPDQTKDHCMVANKRHLHNCGIVVRMPKPGGPARLCGGNHKPEMCPKKAK